MSGASVAFLWHMHQPFYLDPISREVTSPWVRLHAIKGYYDMMALLDEFPQIKATFNVVPSLITQLMAYRDGKATDRFYEYSFLPAAELTPEQKKFILREFFQANWDNMIRPHKRYWDLMGQRGLLIQLDSIDDQLISSFNTQAYLDIQVWFNLAWFGYMARKRFKVIDQLMQKGRNYTEDDKRAVLMAQLGIINEIIPLYKSMQDRGQVELTTSPFYHPILPLLCDSQSALRAMPEALMPARFRHPDDASKQIGMAIDLHKQIFGQAPKGMWPPEGSVSPEIIPLACNAGIEWIATDEAILAHSLKDGNVHDRLYSPFQARFGDSVIDIVFRDQRLSDMVAFAYSLNKPKESSDDFIRRINRIARKHDGTSKPPLISIILDGENSWENYSDGGEDFFRRVYDQLSESSELQTGTVSELIEQYPKKDCLDTLYTGSWIGHNFDIWIGDPEENDAWDCISRTRKFLKEFEENDGKDHPGLDLAWNELYAAEGSDWFWWYGPDFSTDNDPEFDRLFRMHLQNVYRALNTEIPHDLFISLLRKREVVVGEAPTSLIRPSMDGRITDFYEWQGAGYYHCSRGDKAIAPGHQFVEYVYYGFDMDRLFMRFDIDATCEEEADDADLTLNICFVEPRQLRMTMPFCFELAEERKFELERILKDGTFEKIRDYNTIAWDKILEMSLPFSDLDFAPGQEAKFWISIRNNGIEMARYPAENLLEFKVPDESFEAEMWVV